MRKKLYLIGIAISAVTFVGFSVYKVIPSPESPRSRLTIAQSEQVEDENGDRRETHASPAINPGALTTRSYGPFQIGHPRQQPVTIEVQGIMGHPMADDEPTDVAIIVYSTTGKPLLKIEKPYDPDWAYFVRPVRVECPGGGSLLLLEDSELPRAPGYETGGIFYNINSEGRLIPVTEYIQFWNNGNPFNRYSIEELTANNREHLFVASRGWSGSFCIIKYDPIVSDPSNAQSQSLNPDIREHPVLIDEAYALSLRETGMIELFEEPGKADSKCWKLNVDKDSTIRFLGAVPENKDEQLLWWLHITIDGIEGYLADWRHLQIIGLPAAG